MSCSNVKRRRCAELACLSDDALRLILAQLDFKTQCGLGRICHRIRRLVFETLKHFLYVSTSQFSARRNVDRLVGLMRHPALKRLTTVHLRVDSFLDSRGLLPRVGPELGSLEAARIDVDPRFQPRVEDFGILLKLFVASESLTISNFNFVCASHFKLINQYTRLTSVQFCNCRMPFPLNSQTRAVDGSMLSRNTQLTNVRYDFTNIQPAMQKLGDTPFLCKVEGLTSVRLPRYAPVAPAFTYLLIRSKPNLRRVCVPHYMHRFLRVYMPQKTTCAVSIFITPPTLRKL